MSIRITIKDEFGGLLGQISEVSRNHALDALDHSGTVIRDSIRTSFKQTHPSIWGQKYIKGKRHITPEANSAFGMRYSRDGTGLSDTKNMRSFITSWLSERKGTVVIAGKHKSFYAKIRRDGKVVGQVAPKVKGVTYATQAILEKLNYGGAVSNNYKKQIGGNPNKSLFGSATKYKATNFISSGHNKVKSKVEDIMTNKLASLISRKLDKTKVKTETYISKGSK